MEIELIDKIQSQRTQEINAEMENRDHEETQTQER